MPAWIQSAKINRFLAVALAASALTLLPQVFSGSNFAAQANVVVPESSTATTLYVSPPEFRVISTGNTSVVMDFSAAIGQPSGWNEATQRIAVEIAITSTGGDTATVFRGTGNCLVDLSASANADSFGAAVANGSTTPTGVDNAIFVINDRTPQLTINGEIDDVLTAIQRVRIECNSYNNLRDKFVRIGAVPTEDAATCGGANADTNCDPLYYLFSTQHYYRAACSNINATTNVCNISGGSGGNSSQTTTAISNLRDRAEVLSIGVDGTNRTGGSRRGWVATLATRDEILLTDSLRGGNVLMIGTTDLDRAWSWNSGWGGTGTNCSTSEGIFFWLGPDTWCERVPAQNYSGTNERIGSVSTANGTQTRYWRQNGSVWETTDQNGAENAANGGVDFRSTTTPTAITWSGRTNGTGFAHFWHTTSGGVVAEPNSSGDYVYLGYTSGTGSPGWDDAGPGDSNDVAANLTGRPSRFFVEYCSPNQACAAPEIAIASTEILPDQTIDLRKATSKLVDAQSNWTFLSELSFGTNVTNNIVICVSETSTSNFQLRFSILNTASADVSSVISQETITARSDSIFESSADPGQTLIFEGPRATALTVFNGGNTVSSALRVWKPAGTYFDGTERIWIRVVARSEIGRSLLPATLCSRATSDNSWVVSIRPYALQQTIRQGEVEKKR